jgi:predicted HTH transcriptional regulator
MIQTSDIHALLARVESARLEFEGSIREPGELAKLIGAFANTDGGVIVIGRRGSAEIIGTDVERVRQLYKRAKERLVPRPHTSFGSINVDGKPVAVIEVDKANGLVLAESGAYARVGASTQPMTANDVSQALMLSQAGRPDQLEVLARAIADQTNRIEDLSTALAKAHSRHGKAIDYVIGGIVGAVSGYLLSLFA